MAPRFSIVIPCYNRAQTVLPTLHSVQAQTWTDFECIVVDDGSADGAALAEVVAGLNDPRFRLIRRENGGGGAARNTGIWAATGDWIAFLDSDDLFLPEKLATYLQAMTGGETTVYYSQNLVDRGGAKRWVRPDRALRQGEDLGEYLFSHNGFIQTSTIVIATAFARRVLFDPTLPKGQDLDFCIRLAAAGADFRMIATPQSIWCDQTEAGRTSRHRGAAVLEAWLDRASPLLTPRAIRGYRATVLAYHMAETQPLAAALALADGALRGGVPLRITARQALRCFLPRRLYRRAVDFVVNRAGV